MTDKEFTQENQDSTGFQNDVSGGQVNEGRIVNVNNYYGQQKNSAHKKGAKGQAVFVIEGSIEDLTPIDRAKIELLVETLRGITGSATLRIKSIEEGSIRIVLEDDEEGIEALKKLVERGELTKILDKPIKESHFTLSPAEEKLNASSEIQRAILSFLLRSRFWPSKRKEALLGRAKLQGAKLQGAKLLETNLEGANLQGAYLQGAHLEGANLQRVNLQGAYLLYAKLLGTNLEGANLLGANLQRVNLKGANLKGANLKGANLLGANLLGVNLLGANLLGARLEVANLKGANVKGAHLEEANVKGAIFTQATGLSGDQKADLKSRGAIFEDLPGDRSGVLSPVKR